MWSGPRNISTTMMRAFANRTDTAAIDEPFYAYYLRSTGADHPHRAETLAAYPSDWAGVIDWIGTPPKDREKILFLKNIAYHLPDDVDLSFMLPHRNFLLIRDPRAMVASFATKYDDVSPIVRSYELELRMAEYLDAKGAACPIVDAADITRAPGSMLSALCAALNVPFDARMLAWASGPRDEDGPWASHWYDAVWASTGFKPYVEKKLNLSRELDEIAQRSIAPYRQLYARRLIA